MLRSAGSHGPADLVAVKKGRPTLLIQCKKGMGSVDVEEHNKLYRTALESGSLPVIASSADRRPTIFRQITGIAQKTGDAEKVVKGSMF